MGLMRPVPSAETKTESIKRLLLVTQAKTATNGLLVARTPADPEPHEALARLEAVPEHVELLIELVTLRTGLLRLPGNASHFVGRHQADRERGQDAVQSGHQLGLNHFDRHVVDKPF